MKQDNTIKKINLIAKKVALEFGYSVEDITQKTRKREIVEPRQIAHYLCSKHVKGANLALIGRCIGKKDHATVMHSRNSIENAMDTIAGYSEIIEKYGEYCKSIITKIDNQKIGTAKQSARILVTKRAASIRNKTKYNITINIES